MSFRFWRRVSLAPGVTLNLSKSGGSLSFGPRGAKYTIGPRGRRATVGLPGTGLFYTVHEPNHGGRQASPPVPARDRLDLGFFQRLFTPADERGLVEGLRAVTQGDEAAALAALDGVAHLPDAAWILGMLRLKGEEFGAARRHFETVLAGLERLGTYLDKYEVVLRVSLPITPEVQAEVFPRERGTRLALVEIAQREGRRDEAMAHLDRLLEIDATDPVVLVSFAELALDDPDDRALMERVVALTASAVNDTSIDTALLLYRARALAALGLADAAIEVLTLANRRRKDRAPELLRQIRYDRAVLYDQVGRRAQARREFERLYAEDPGFEDLRARLGLEA